MKKIRVLEALSAAFPNYEGRAEEEEKRILRNLRLVMLVAFSKGVPFLPICAFCVVCGER